MTYVPVKLRSVEELYQGLVIRQQHLENAYETILKELKSFDKYPMGQFQLLTAHKNALNLYEKEDIRKPLFRVRINNRLIEISEFYPTTQEKAFDSAFIDNAIDFIRQELAKLKFLLEYKGEKE